jgi:hypothetical protein
VGGLGEQVTMIIEIKGKKKLIEYKYPTNFHENYK